MKKIIVLSLCLFAFSCAHTAQTHVPIDENYPYSAIEPVYDTILEIAMSKFLPSIETDGKHYADELKLFVERTMPKSKFISILTSNEDTKRIFDRAKTDIDYRDTKEFSDRFNIVVNVAVKKGPFMFACCFDVFATKYVHPTEMTEKLFLMTDNEDYETYICWVYGKVSHEEVKKELGDKIEILPDDIFYAFSSPLWYWQQMAGRQGYLQVRGDKIIKAHITMLN